MAFRSSIIVNFRFDPRFGRQGNDPILGEETALFRKIREQGLQGVWVPSAKVRHYLPRERCTPKYIRKYAAGFGRTLVREQGVRGVKFLFGAPRWLYRNYLHLRWKSFSERILRQPKWAVTYFQAALIKGMISESRAQFKAASLQATGESKTEIP